MYRQVKQLAIAGVVTGFGLGKIPVAPGTFGSILGLGLGGVLHYVSAYHQVIAWLMFGLIFAVSHQCIRQYELSHGHHDAAEIVIDEILGLGLVYLWVPVSLMNLGIGFGLFRLFDITKIGPVGWCERRLHGLALGTLMDDLMAGFMVLVVFGLISGLGWIELG